MTDETTDIALVISDLGSGGSQKVLRSLSEHLVSVGQRVAVVTMSSTETDFFQLPNGVRRVSIGLHGQANYPGAGFLNNARRIIRLRQTLHALQVRSAIGFIAPTAVLLVAASWVTGIRTIAAERNDPQKQSFGWIWDRLRRFAYRHAGAVTANSQSAVESIRTFVDNERVFFTPNPLPFPFHGAPAILHRPTILAVGRLHRQKGFDILLEAFALLRPNTWNLVILGEGPEEQSLKMLAKTLDVTHQIIFMGALQDPFPYYRSADIFVLPSRHEGMPNSLMEAMSFGMPCVVSDASNGISDLVKDGETGLAFPSESIQALSETLQLAVDSSELRDKLGLAAKDDMDQRRSCDNSFEHWDQAIASVTHTVAT